MVSENSLGSLGLKRLRFQSTALRGKTFCPACVSGQKRVPISVYEEPVLLAFRDDRPAWLPMILFGQAGFIVVREPEVPF